MLTPTLEASALVELQRLRRFVETVAESDCVNGNGGCMRGCAEKPQCQICKELAIILNSK